LSLVKYIHLNPARARAAQSVGEYRWSTHQSYTKTVQSDIIDTDQVLRMFAEDKGKARKLYRVYMEGGPAVDKGDIYSTIDQRILGDEQFAEEVMEKTEIEIQVERRTREYPLAAIAGAIEEMRGVTLDEIRGKRKDRGISSARKIFSHVARAYGYKGREIADYTRKDAAIITRYLKEKEACRKDAEKVIEILRKRRNVNRQV
jgi:hypothetical protein